MDFIKIQQIFQFGIVESLSQQRKIDNKESRMSPFTMSFKSAKAGVLLINVPKFGQAKLGYNTNSFVHGDFQIP